MSIGEQNEEHPIYRTAEHDPDDCDFCNQRAQKVRDFFKMIEVPIMKSTTQTGSLSTSINVRGYLLYDILMDDKKFKALAYKLKLKAFW